MDRFRILTLAALVWIGVGAQGASAQTAASIVIVAGNGQMTCQGCFTQSAQIPFQFFNPLAVKVLDSLGNPIPNKQVNWSLISSQGPLPFYNTQSFTDGNGVTTNTLQQATQPGTIGFPFMQSVLAASADGVSVSFTETQGLSLPSSTGSQTQLVFAAVTSPGIGTNFTGTAGAPSSTPITVHVDAFGTPVPNVAVRLLNSNDPTQGATVSCATGAGADPGSVLTDSTGNATCTPIFGPIAGSGNFTVLVGAEDPAAGFFTPIQGQSYAYFQSQNFPITVTPATAGQVLISSGNNQTINAGQASQPLVVKVTDAAGVNPISGQAVVFTVSPAGAATLSPSSTTTNSQGLASTVATLSASAVGTITVKAALTGSLSNISTAFTLTVNVQITGLQKISGDTQSVPAGQAFPAPLVVQANASNGQPAQGIPVSFGITGPGTLNTGSATTDSNGRAQVSVTAGATAGTVTVTASTGGFSQSFTLTVVPPGPNLAAGTLLNGADFQAGSISPCSIVTLQATGLAPGIQGVVIPSWLYGPQPYTLGGDTVSVGGSQAPIFNLSHMGTREQITFQLPCDVTPGSSVPLTVNVSGGSATTNITVLPASPGIFGTVMSDGVTRAVMVRPDGSFVSLENPARRGEIIRLYGTGLGPTNPSVATNSVAIPGGADSVVTGQIIVGVANAGARVISGRLAPSLIGVYEVAFQVDPNAPTGNDVVLSLAVNVVGDSTTRFSAGSKIPIQ